jgi:hypothetical protein
MLTTEIAHPVLLEGAKLESKESACLLK